MATIQQLIPQQKRLLRKTVSAGLSLISSNGIEVQSHKITERIRALPVFKSSQGVCCYLSMPSGEVSTASIVSAILKSEKRLFVPKMLNKKEGMMDCFEIYGEEDLASLLSGQWGIKEPETSWNGTPRTHALQDDNELLDLILLPAVAYDRSFSRLGHGKGYYDRFIASYSANDRHRPVLVGLSLREQLLGSGAIPMSDHDWRMDMIITPDEVLIRAESDVKERESSSS
ncbi:5-formyltetrahydrofolate cyclo-ligase [Coprinellus micaceus]|uniref:5-formyltetrahydrofolate cyclo-ligase n=1 Tax=Coprinellus micaceus TaxID=71717 RepID=A0A4Y7SNW6_COPMI|nr:5-formyltetrahydrofolate cyclo-ligase [Coprinellus micaceus]